MNTEKYSEPKRPPLCLKNASKLTIQENNTQRKIPATLTEGVREWTSTDTKKKTVKERVT